VAIAKVLLHLVTALPDKIILFPEGVILLLPLAPRIGRRVLHQGRELFNLQIGPGEISLLPILHGTGLIAIILSLSATTGGVINRV
jgi:hypothetical protein